MDVSEAGEGGDSIKWRLVIELTYMEVHYDRIAKLKNFEEKLVALKH